MAGKSITIRPNPFPGLRSYRPDEGHLFFGRAESTQKVVSRLKENSFVAILGASGSGKSSLALSGVIPALIKENAEGKKSWSYIVFKPDRKPVDHLASELAALSAGAGFSQLTEMSVAASLHNRTEGLTDVINRIRKNLRQQIVIVIDQFEEIFRFSPAVTRGSLGDDATDFIDMIVNSVQRPDQGLFILLTLRSEYVSECARFHSLTNLMNKSSYLLPQIPPNQLAAVIEEPVRISGSSIDHSLVRMILTDIGDRPGNLPVLQHVMMRLWDHWSRTGDMSRPLSITDYEAVGKAKGALSQHAAQALELLDERHLNVCARLFRTITERNEEGREMRKPERISTIAEKTGCTVSEIIRVAEIFRSPEYSFLTPSKEMPLDKDTILDLSHETIIRLWGTLRKWMEEEELSKKLYTQLAAAAAMYQDGNGRLWTGPDLMLALRWREDNNPTLAWAETIDPAFERTMLFLKNSEEEHAVQEEYDRKSGRDRIKRSRFMAGLLGLFSLITLVAFGTVYTLRARAERQRLVAVQMKDEALAMADSLKDSLEYLTESLKSADTLTASEINSLIEAGIKARQAIARAVYAESAMKEITEEKTAALEKEAEANRYMMLSMAKALALRSVSFSGEKDLQILLALQSFIFNERHTGYTEDADVFAALYEAGKQYGNRFYGRYVPDDEYVTAMTGGAGGQFFTADAKGRILSWHPERPAMGYEVISSGDRLIKVMTLSPDREWLACGTQKSGIVMIPINDDTIGYTLQDSCIDINSLIFADGGKRLYSSASDGGVRLWDLTTRRSVRIIDDDSGIKAMRVSVDMSQMAALTNGGKVILWKLETPGRLSSLQTGDRFITALMFMPGTGLLATGDRSGMIDLWNTSSMNAESSFEGHNSLVTAIAFNNTDDQMLTADDNGEIKLWTLAGLSQPPVVFSDSNGEILSLDFSDEGKAFLTATDREVIRRPAHIRYMTDNLCDKVTRNLSEQEWNAYVGQGIEYEATCPDKAYRIRVKEIRGAR